METSTYYCDCGWQRSYPAGARVNCPLCKRRAVELQPSESLPEPKDRRRNREAMLGDALEDFLASHGITKEWYAEFKREHGLPPACGCSARQEWLNKTSDAHPTVANIGVKLLSFFTRKKTP